MPLSDNPTWMGVEEENALLSRLTNIIGKNLLSSMRKEMNKEIETAGVVNKAMIKHPGLCRLLGVKIGTDMQPYARALQRLEKEDKLHAWPLYRITSTLKRVIKHPQKLSASSHWHPIRRMVLMSMFTRARVLGKTTWIVILPKEVLKHLDFYSEAFGYNSKFYRYTHLLYRIRCGVLTCTPKLSPATALLLKNCPRVENTSANHLLRTKLFQHNSVQQVISRIVSRLASPCASAVFHEYYTACVLTAISPRISKSILFMTIRNDWAEDTTGLYYLTEESTRLFLFNTSLCHVMTTDVDDVVGFLSWSEQFVVSFSKLSDEQLSAFTQNISPPELVDVDRTKQLPSIQEQVIAPGKKRWSDAFGMLRMYKAADTVLKLGDVDTFRKSNPNQKGSQGSLGSRESRSTSGTTDIESLKYGSQIVFESNNFTPLSFRQVTKRATSDRTNTCRVSPDEVQQKERSDQMLKYIVGLVPCERQPLRKKPSRLASTSTACLNFYTRIRLYKLHYYPLKEMYLSECGTRHISPVSGVILKLSTCGYLLQYCSEIVVRGVTVEPLLPVLMCFSNLQKLEIFHSLCSFEFLSILSSILKETNSLIDYITLDNCVVDDVPNGEFIHPLLTISSQVRCVWVTHCSLPQILDRHFNKTKSPYQFRRCARNPFSNPIPRSTLSKLV